VDRLASGGRTYGRAAATAAVSRTSSAFTFANHTRLHQELPLQHSSCAPDGPQMSWRLSLRDCLRPTCGRADSEEHRLRKNVPNALVARRRQEAGATRAFVPSNRRRPGDGGQLAIPDCSLSLPRLSGLASALARPRPHAVRRSNRGALFPRHAVLPHRGWARSAICRFASWP